LVFNGERRECGGSYLDGPVFVNQQVGRPVMLISMIQIKRKAHLVILQITMDNSSRVDELEALEDIDDHVAEEREGELQFIVVQHVVQAAARHEFSDDAQLGGVETDSHKEDDV
jgi:hypothetical protein